MISKPAEQFASFRTEIVFSKAASKTTGKPRQSWESSSGDLLIVACLYRNQLGRKQFLHEYAEQMAAFLHFEME